ncbi:bax inhibitor 1-like, partial [Diaphorina citri]|uniref:Bax inhibitor 1-like n=1 Tax=Diaphorina citri TaxID=121845 RepID=A0A1S4EPL5_DIACI
MSTCRSLAGFMGARFMKNKAYSRGIGLGPLLEMAIVVNPSIVVTAFMLTTLLFVSFTLAAIFAREGQWIYIGGSLMTMLSTLITLSLANLFFGSKLLFD